MLPTVLLCLAVVLNPLLTQNPQQHPNPAVAQKKPATKALTARISSANPNWIAADTEVDLFTVAYMVNNGFSEADIERQLLGTGNYFLVKSGTKVDVLRKNERGMVKIRMPDKREGWLPAQAVPMK